MADKTSTGTSLLNSPGGSDAVLAGADSAMLSRIEELLQTQVTQNKKLLRASRWRTFFLIALVGVFIVFGSMFYSTIRHITDDIPRVIDEADELIVTATDAVRTIVTKIDALDIDALNESIEGIASIDYSGLNTSIGGLASSVEKFEAFVDALQNPGRAIAGLFGG